VLLFVRKQYSDAIRDGSKRFEIRAGSRYGKIAVGDSLSINGHFRVTVDAVDPHTRESLIAAMPDWRDAIESCYPGDYPGPYFVFHFKPPTAASSPRSVA
jgi:ASC-1-like (ASCH) protein